MLCVGGGGGGANGQYGGGASGYLNSGVFLVVPGSVFPVTVGRGGGGGNRQYGSGSRAAGNSPGAKSSIGNLLNCAGGETSRDLTIAKGGSGGGGGCFLKSNKGGIGGTNGESGEGCDFGVGGSGQGSFTPYFSSLSFNTFVAGAGGSGGTTEFAGGGGGGGVLVNGDGTSADNGTIITSGKGGRGFGAGGGAGGYESITGCSYAWGGGNGAAGLIYIEWDSPSMSHFQRIIFYFNLF